MPMGNADNRYQVVDSDAVRKAVGDEVFERFMDRFGELVSHAKAVELDESDINLALQGEMCGFGEELTYWKHVADAYKELRAIFHESTGMCISYMFTSGEGDYYDDLSPETWYWTIPTDDVWIRTMSPSMKSFIEKFGKCVDFDQRFSEFG